MAAQITDSEQEGKEGQQEGKHPTQGGGGAGKMSDLFRFATLFDFFITLIGVLCAMGVGMGIPIVALIIRDIINRGFTLGPAGIPPTLIYNMAFQILYTAAGLFGAAFFAIFFLALTAARQGEKVRKSYLAAILRQDVSWLDRHMLGAIASSYERECFLVQAAVGDKLGSLFQNVATFLGSTAIAFSQGWKITLVLLAAIPVLFLIVILTRGVRGKLAERLNAALNASGALCDQSIMSMRTIASLRAEKREVNALSAHLKNWEAASNRLSLIQALISGVFVALFFLAFAIGLWFGAHMQQIEEWNHATGRFYNGADSALVFVCVLLAVYHSGQLSPALRAISEGNRAASGIVELMRSSPGIDIRSDSGKTLQNLQGAIKFDNVHFSYPSRPDARVLKGLSMQIPAGSKIALVGLSGNGKSTIVQLVMRFYDPLQGAVSLDGEDLRGLSVRWLRRQIGLVSQEPVLFSTSVIENVRISRQDASQEDVEKACKAATAHAFVTGLPEGYNTLCGDRGTQLSGGQKQRIAIARAIISNPKILLLDEATSALDSESEKLVQAALDDFVGGCTVISVAHRLSTIRNVDRIIVLKSGEICQQGTHDQLVGVPGGVYSGLIAPKADLVGQSEGSPSHLGKAGPQGVHVTGGSLEDKLSHLGPGGSQAQGRRSSWLGGANFQQRGGGSSKGDVRRALGLAAPEAIWVSGGCLGMLLSGAVAPVLCWLLVELVMLYFRCFQIDMPVIFFKEDKYMLIGYKEENVQCESPCILNYAVSGSPQGTLLSSTEPCTMRKFDTMCMLLSDFSIKFYDSPLHGVCYEEMLNLLTPWIIGVGILGAAAGLSNFIQGWAMGIVAQRVGKRLRMLSFSSLLRQHIGFFDAEENSAGTLAARIVTDSAVVESAVSTTLGNVLANVMCIIGTLIIGFLRGPLLTAICLVVFPVKIIITGMWWCIRRCAETNRADYNRASSLSHEAISAAKTIAALAIDREIEKICDAAVTKAGRSARGIAFVSGLGHGFTYLVQFLLYFTAFVAGARLMIWNGYGFDDVLKVFLSIAFAGIAAQLVSIRLPDLTRAKAALSRLFALIDLQSQINPDEDSGDKPSSISGDLMLRDVAFTYPSRPDAPVFTNLNLHVEAGRTVALVGASGCGKSTIIQLIERFYDPSEGQVLLDGTDVRNLSLKWLRSQMSLVAQEPVLFATTVRDNIEYGKEGCAQSEIEAAARRANAHDFISRLPQGYETLCGERGAQMSGGQKQRIAIARALISDPKILLLDEATSALDSESEKLVQAALDASMRGRTTLVVAHRLSTIRNADKIVVLRKGEIVEQGTHQQLASNPLGAYSALVKSQVALG